MLLLNITKVLSGIKYLRMDQVNFFGCLPQILLGPLLNTLSLMVQCYMDSPGAYSEVLEKRYIGKNLKNNDI